MDRAELLRDLCDRIGHDEIMLMMSTGSVTGVMLRCQRCSRERYFEGRAGEPVRESPAPMVIAATMSRDA